MMLLGLSRLLWKQLNFDSFCKRHLFYCSDDVFTSTVFENSNIAAWNKIALAYLALKTPQIKLDTPGTQGPVCGSCWTHHWTHHNSAYYIKKNGLSLTPEYPQEFSVTHVGLPFTVSAAADGSLTEWGCFHV